jgi:hypothetical protein
LAKKKTKRKNKPRKKTVYQEPPNEPPGLNEDGSINEYYLTRGKTQNNRHVSVFESEA